MPRTILLQLAAVPGLLLPGQLHFKLPMAEQVARPKTVASDQTSRALAIGESRAEWVSLALVGVVIEVRP
eukprot:174807-Amphidinium_carterae.1